MFCLKNAMRAVVEQHGSSIDIPPLKILITKGKQDLTIKVSGTCVKYDPNYYVFFFLSSYTTSQLLGLQRLKKSEKIKLRLSEFWQYCHHRLIFASHIDDFPN